MQVTLICCIHADDLSLHVEAALADVAVKNTLVNSSDVKDIAVQASMVYHILLLLYHQ